MSRPSRAGGAGTLVLVGLLAALIAGPAAAALSGQAQAGLTVGTLALVPPDTVTATGSCASATIGWTAASGADSYRVQVQEGAGGWTDLDADTGYVTQTTDPGPHTAATTVTYRVLARHTASGWQSAVATSSTALTC